MAEATVEVAAAVLAQRISRLPLEKFSIIQFKAPLHPYHCGPGCSLRVLLQQLLLRRVQA